MERMDSEKDKKTENGKKIEKQRKREKDRIDRNKLLVGRWKRKNR